MGRKLLSRKGRVARIMAVRRCLVETIQSASITLVFLSFMRG